jgi:uncharacterized protein YqhQ
MPVPEDIPPADIAPKKEPFFYGGQAVIEGVMMRGPHHMAVAVRNPRGEVVIHGEPVKGGIYQSRWGRLPFLRGVLTLWDTLALGMRSLGFAANVSMGGEREKAAIEESNKGFEQPILAALVVALTLTIGLFFVLPVLVASLADSHVGSALVSNLVEKVVRLGLILGYVVAIGFLPDVRRVFGYHGAEHKAINAYEAGVELTVPNVRGFTLIHPRCGTTFLLIVVLVSFVVFSLLGRPPLVERVVSRIILTPVIAGIAYELIRLGATHYHRRFVRWLLAPGLIVQRLTTREPDDSMLEVSIAALQRVLADEKAMAPLVAVELPVAEVSPAIP